MNLRKEEYAHDSRVPVIEFGTPFEDASRRDLTINSLFYNINENKVEDFTQKGIMDMKNGLIRTPLEPLKTFLDDPLRVMRVFRFAARFNFTLDPSIMPAIHNTQVLDSLQHKVSKERIGKELEPALEHENSVKFLNYLHEAGLLSVIFSVTDKTTDSITSQQIKDMFDFNSKIWNKIMHSAQEMQSVLLEVNKSHIE